MLNLRKKCSFYALTLLLVLVIGGCGGGGGTTSGSRTTKAKTSLKTSGLVTSGLLVGALEVVISFPYGVTVECIPGTNEPVQSVVTLVGLSDPAMTMNALTYVAATPSTRGSLKIDFVNAAGFTPSDSLSVQLDITTGFFPTSSDFSLTKFEIATFSSDNLNYTALTPVLNPVFTAEVI